MFRSGRNIMRALRIVPVHFDAFRLAPRTYLIATWWRIRRKRVRSRAQFSALLSRSPRAYSVWVDIHREAPNHTPEIPEKCTLLALVQPVDDTKRLAATLTSLKAAAIPYRIVDAVGPAALAREIDWSVRPWLMPIGEGDTVAPGAADCYGRASASAAGDVVYADDDLFSPGGRRTKPHFKPSWNPELFRHHDFLTGACIVRTTEAQFLAHATKPDWAAQLVADAANRGTPHRLPLVLHHRITRPLPQVPGPAAVLRNALPEVSVIIPTRNRLDLLRTCLSGLARTDYPQMQILIVDNDSDDPATLAFLREQSDPRVTVLRHPGPFNYSAINNRAVEHARGKLLCLMNNDVEVVEPSWLSTMAMQALRDDVGAVGARLLYPDGRIQHAGVVMAICGGAAHAHRLLRPDEEGYHCRHRLPQFTSAVTAACLVVQREKFLAVGGLNERAFRVAFNDVDLCMRLNARGWQSLYEPRATLIHHESVSRGFDKDPAGAARFAGELAELQGRWGTRDGQDPYHHPELSPFSEQFVVRL